MLPQETPKSPILPHKPKRSATADKNAVASAMRAKSSTNLKEFSFCMTASSFSYGIGTIRFHTAWNVSHAHETRRYGIWQFLLRGKNCYFDHDKRRAGRTEEYREALENCWNFAQCRLNARGAGRWIPGLPTSGEAGRRRPVERRRHHRNPAAGGLCRRAFPRLPILARRNDRARTTGGKRFMASLGGIHPRRHWWRLTPQSPDAGSQPQRASAFPGGRQHGGQQLLAPPVEPLDRRSDAKTKPLATDQGLPQRGDHARARGREIRRFIVSLVARQRDGEEGLGNLRRMSGPAALGVVAAQEQTDLLVLQLAHQQNADGGSVYGAHRPWRRRKAQRMLRFDDRQILQLQATLTPEQDGFAGLGGQSAHRILNGFRPIRHARRPVAEKGNPYRRAILALGGIEFHVAPGHQRLEQHRDTRLGRAKPLDDVRDPQRPPFGLEHFLQLEYAHRRLHHCRFPTDARAATHVVQAR